MTEQINCYICWAYDSIVCVLAGAVTYFSTTSEVVDRSQIKIYVLLSLSESINVYAAFCGVKYFHPITPFPTDGSLSLLYCYFYGKCFKDLHPLHTFKAKIWFAICIGLNRLTFEKMCSTPKTYSQELLLSWTYFCNGCFLEQYNLNLFKSRPNSYK